MKKISLLVLIFVLAAFMLITLSACSDHDSHEFGENWAIDKDNHYHLCGCGEKADSAAHVDEDNNAACDVCGITMPHTAHANSDFWAYNAENHFHVCTTCGEKADAAAHADADNNESCDVCGMKMAHTVHSFGTEWKYDDANHFHVCPECGEKADSAAHADADNDGKCDVCTAVIPTDHIYSSDWSSDATNHWHAPVCGHDVAVKDSAAHTADKLGVCTVCGYKVSAPDVSTVAKAFEIAKLQQKYVLSGEFINMNQYDVLNHALFDYGEGYFTSQDLYYGSYVYATMNADGTLCLVEINPENFSEPNKVVLAETNLGYLDGIAIDLQQYINESEVCYGVIDIFEFFYSDYLEVYGEGVEPAEEVADGLYTFGYEIVVSDVRRNITMMFELDEKDYFIKNFAIIITTYDGEQVGDQAIFAFEQWIIPESDHTPEDVIPTDYNFYIINDEYEEELLVFNDQNTAAAIETKLSSLAYSIYIGDILPVNGIIEILGVDVVVKDENGVVAGNVAYPTFSPSTYSADILFFEVGEYTVEITVGNETYKIPFSVDYADPEVIYPTFFNDKWFAFENISYTYEDLEIPLYIGQKLTLGADFDDGCEPNFYEASITSNNASDATWTPLGLIDDGFGGEVKAYEFTGNAAGTYYISFRSSAAEDVFETVTVVVSEPPAAKDIAKGKWVGGNMMMGTYTANFYPTNDEKGVVVVTIVGRGIPEEAILTYNIVDEEIIAVPYGAANAKVSAITISDAYNIVISGATGETELMKDANAPDPYTNGELPEAPDYVPSVQDDYEPVIGGHGGNAMGGYVELPIEAIGTYKYKTTVAAGAKSAFQPVNITSASGEPGWLLTITVDFGDVTTTVKDPSQPTPLVVTPTDLAFNYDKYMYNLVFENTGASEVEVKFTVTVEDACQSVVGGNGSAGWGGFTEIEIQETGVYYYKTTVEAGAKSAFQFNNYVAAEGDPGWLLTITINSGEVTTEYRSYSAPGPITPTPGMAFNYDDYYYQIIFDNTAGADPIDIVFTLEVVDAPAA